MGTPSALYKAIVCVDIEGFTDPGRNDQDRVTMREALYRALENSFARSGIPREKCYSEDRGDGAFFLVDPDVPKARLVEPLPFELATKLSLHNHAADAATVIRLRVAIHAGDVVIESKGVVGDPLNVTFRLLNAPEFKLALRDAPDDLALVTSDGFFTEVVRQHRTVDPSTYREALVTAKDTKVKAWICTSDLQHRAGHEYGERVPRIEATLAAIGATLRQASRNRDATVEKIASPVPEVPDLDTGLRERLAALAAPERGRWSEFIAEMAELEHAAAAALARARAADRDVRAPLERRDELRGLLNSYQAMAARRGRVEDSALDVLHQRAAGLLWSAPCDLRVAEAATMRYVRAVQEDPAS